MKFEHHRFLRCAGSFLLAIGLLGLALGIVQGAGGLTRVTTASSPLRDSNNARLSADGTTIAFNSDADFFHQGILTDQLEIWLYR